MRVPYAAGWIVLHAGQIAVPDSHFAGPSPDASLDTRRATAMLLWSLAFAYSLAPFEFSSAAVAAAARSSPDVDLLSLVGHFLAFTALGTADARMLGNRHGVFNGPLARGLMFCIAIEVGQVFLAARHPAITDLAVNVFGIVAGHLVGALGALRTGTVRKRHGLPRGDVVAVLLWGFFWCSAFGLSGYLAGLRSWDPTYHLLIGDEDGGQRPWAGEVRSIAIYDRALNDLQAQMIFERPVGSPEGVSIRAGMGLLVAYDFTRNGRVELHGAAANNPALSIQLPESASWQGENPSALVFSSARGASSVGPATAVSAGAAGTGAFSVEAWLRPRGLQQSGPARIVGISKSIWRRNFTLGQEGNGLTFRVRNGLNGPNGDTYALRVSDVVTQEFGHVVATYDHGVSALFRDARKMKPTIDLREPAVLLGFGTTAASRIATALIAALSLIFLASWFAPGTPFARLLLSGYAVLTVPVIAGFLLGFHPAVSLHVWFGPALTLCWFASRRGSRDDSRPADR